MLTSTISPTGGVKIMVKSAIFLDIFVMTGLADAVANIYWLYGRCCCQLCLILCHQSDVIN